MKTLLVALSLTFLTAGVASAEPALKGPQIEAGVQQALVDGLKLVRDNKWDEWLKSYCSPSKLCLNDNSKKSLKTYNLPATQRRTKACLKAGDTVQVTRVDEVGTDDFKVFVQCEETAMPVPFRLGKENGKWLFRSI
ncbi:MAG: hypothetical protein JNJ59_19995 [Deltaproteobacteria bacterium]|jgi:hypothetical protein|nr:hypothetical protein [Deltaproteobacteria bacterium]